MTRQRVPARMALVLACLVVGCALQSRADHLRLVERVVDGDTIELDGGETVRLIGVDTPETVHPRKPVERFGKQATAFTTRLAEGKRVRLERDRETAGRDRYGRTLAYVWLAMANSSTSRSSDKATASPTPSTRSPGWRSFGPRSARRGRRGEDSGLRTNRRMKPNMPRLMREGRQARAGWPSRQAASPPNSAARFAPRARRAATRASAAHSPAVRAAGAPAMPRRCVGNER